LCRSGRKSPVEDGGHVAGAGEVSAVGGFLEVAVGMFAGFGGEIEEVGAEGRPSRFGGQARDVLVDAVEVGDSVGSDELFAGDADGVGIALDGVEQSGGWVVEFAELRCGGRRGVVAGEDLLENLGRCAGSDGFGTDDALGVAVADDLEVQVVGVPTAGEHRVELLPGFLPGE
jgi:hypothetical protein